MNSRFKIIALFITTVIIILTVLAGLTFAADNSSKLAAAITNISAYIYAGQYYSCIKDISLVTFVFLLALWRTLFLKRQQ
jgi:hypothetical protein